jgi:endoglucanase
MDPVAVDFLKRLLSSPSPSGYEGPVQDIVREYASGFADTIRTDVHGNVIASLNPEGHPRLMLAGHCDQIGLLVSHIDAEGFLYAQTIGGWDPQQLIGQRLTIWTSAGPVAAVISRKPIHLLTEEERKQVVKEKDLWLDIGAMSKAEAEAIR